MFSDACETGDSTGKCQVPREAMGQQSKKLQPAYVYFFLGHFARVRVQYCFVSSD